MATVIINGIECQGGSGERLVDIARRHAAHIGFLCDGLGAFFVESSACRVLRGAEHLSPPTELEQKWLQQSWLDAGHRLACEVTLRGSGPVEILSRAEELRRQTIAIFAPPEDTEAGDNMGQLFNHVGRIVLNQLMCLPGNMLSSVAHLGGKPANAKGTEEQSAQAEAQGMLTDIQKMTTDGFRVVQQMLGGPVDGQSSSGSSALPAPESARR
jgi:ferredoxin